MGRAFSKWIGWISRSITKKYIIIFLFILIIPTIVVYNIIIGYAKMTMEKALMDGSWLKADSLARQLDQEIADVVLLLEQIPKTDADHLDVPTLYDRAKSIVSRSPIIHSIYFLDKREHLLFEAPFVPHVDKPMSYPSYNDVRWSMSDVVSDLFSNDRKENVVSIAVPVIESASQFNGVLVAEISKPHLLDLLNSKKLSNEGFCFILDKKGQVISSSDRNDIGKNFSQLPLFQKIYKGSSGVATEEYHGEKSIIAYRVMSDGWGLVFGTPEYVAFQPVSNLSVVLTLGFAVILLLALFTIIAGVKNILYPIIQLTKLSRNFTSEESLHKIRKMGKYRSNDELGILMRTMTLVGFSNLRKRKMLEEKERYLHDLLEGIPYAILTVDNEGQVTYLNQNFVSLTGIPREQMFNKYFWELPIKNDESDFVLARALQSSLATEEKETYIIDTKGNKRIVKAVTSKFYNDLNIQTGVVCVLQDISQIKYLETHLKQSEKLAAIGQITTGIAHEIKNPLAILAGGTELLKEEVAEQNVTVETRELVSDLLSVVNRMKGLVNDFLNFAKINNDEIKPISLPKLMDEVLRLLRIKLNESKVVVNKDYDRLDGSVQGKYDKLMQTYLNLILNSIEAMPLGGNLTICIYQMEAENKQWVAVEIRDTGVGISPQNLDWLFNPFFTTKSEGSGLGLTIARDIIYEHQGKIDIQSQVHTGTTILSRYPLYLG
jgi:PAS domain S-box-containing protein